MLIWPALVIFCTLILLAVFLRIFDEKWYRYYLFSIAICIALPIAILIKLFSIAISIITLFWRLVRIVVVIAGKSIVFLVIGALHVIIIGITYFVPFLGGLVQRTKPQLDNSVIISTLVKECKYTRGMMVGIVAEQSNRNYTFGSEDLYRDKLESVKENGKRKLAIGELVLSLSIGSILLASQIFGLGVFERSFGSFTIAMGIQVALLGIVISIVYRVSILEFLAYAGDEEFSSLDELDSALSYQEAVANIGFVQYLVFMLVLGMRLTNADRDTVEKVLEVYSGDKNYRESMVFALKLLRQENKTAK